MAILRVLKPQMVLVVILSMALSSLLAACTDTSATPAPGGGNAGTETTSTTSTAPVKITVFAPQDTEQDLATNAFTKEMSQRFNIQFSWQTTTYDNAPAKDKRQLVLAGKDYPELFLLIPWVDQFSQAELLRYSNQGILIPLNDLIKQYAPNIQAALDKNPDYKAMATAPDGKIYGLPQWVDCFHCSYQSKLWLNTGWLKKLGLQMPTTTEEMRTVLTAFKTKDPNGNGKADEIPLSANTRDVLIPYFMNAFIYNPQGTNGGNNNSLLVLKNGKVDITANKEGWKQGLAYIKTLNEAGLIDPNAFTQSPDALKKIGDNPGETILGSAAVLHPDIFLTVDGADGRGKQYDAVPPLKGPSGVQYTSYNFPSVPGATFALTNKAGKSAQIAAIKMLDYIFTTEGEIRAMFGDERAVVKPGAGDIALEAGITPLYKRLPGPPPNSRWSALAQYNNTREFRGAEVVPGDIYKPGGYERRLVEATKLYARKEDKAQIYPYWGVWVDPGLGKEIATLQANLEDYVQKNSLQFILGAKSLDKDWDDYVRGLEQLGLPRYLEIQQQAYDKSPYKK